MFSFLRNHQVYREHSELFAYVMQKIATENFEKLIGKHMCWILFIDKVKSILQLS